MRFKFLISSPDMCSDCRYLLHQDAGGKKPNRLSRNVKRQMIRSEDGNIVQSWWNNIPSYFMNTQLDQFVVMPNHVHGIIIIDDDVIDPVGARFPRPYKRPTSGNIVAYFKYQSTRQINEIRNNIGDPIWQCNYIEHIIRNVRSLRKSREYFETNPGRWQMDNENVDKPTTPLLNHSPFNEFPLKADALSAQTN